LSLTLLFLSLASLLRFLPLLFYSAALRIVHSLSSLCYVGGKRRARDGDERRKRECREKKSGECVRRKRGGCEQKQNDSNSRGTHIFT
jgi:hypothetical protein